MIQRNARRLFITLVLGAALTANAAAALFGPPRADPWPYWDVRAETPVLEVDHGPWQAFLADWLVTDHPSGVNLVRYGDVDAAGHARLDRYLETLQGLDPRRLTRAQQLAYWINLYNALTVDLVLDQWRVDSIREIGAGWFSPGPWDRELATVADQALTLNDIEHRILRPLFDEPRIHFAVNCAAMGCPELAAEPYRAGEVEAQLAAQTGDFLAHPRGARFADGRLVLSSIFDWYRDDFPAGRAPFMAWLAERAPGDLAERLRGYRGGIRHEYDWSLNAAP